MYNMIMNKEIKAKRFRWNIPQYTYGDNQFGIQFPVITFCDKLPEYKNILGEDCGQKVCVHKDWIGDGFCDDLTNTPGCNYDGGDCCLGTIHILLNAGGKGVRIWQLLKRSAHCLYMDLDGKKLATSNLPFLTFEVWGT